MREKTIFRLLILMLLLAFVACMEDDDEKDNPSAAPNFETGGQINTIVADYETGAFMRDATVTLIADSGVMLITDDFGRTTHFVHIGKDYQLLVQKAGYASVLCSGSLVHNADGELDYPVASYANVKVNMYKSGAVLSGLATYNDNLIGGVVQPVANANIRFDFDYSVTGCDFVDNIVVKTDGNGAYRAENLPLYADFTAYPYETTIGGLIYKAATVNGSTYYHTDSVTLVKRIEYAVQNMQNHFYVVSPIPLIDNKPLVITKDAPISITFSQTVDTNKDDVTVMSSSYEVGVNKVWSEDKKTVTISSLPNANWPTGQNIVVSLKLYSEGGLYFNGSVQFAVSDATTIPNVTLVRRDNITAPTGHNYSGYIPITWEKIDIAGVTYKGYTKKTGGTYLLTNSNILDNSTNIAVASGDFSDGKDISVRIVACNVLACSPFDDTNLVLVLADNAEPKVTGGYQPPYKYKGVIVGASQSVRSAYDDGAGNDYFTVNFDEPMKQENFKIDVYDLNSVSPSSAALAIYDKLSFDFAWQNDTQVRITPTVKPNNATLSGEAIRLVFRAVDKMGNAVDSENYDKVTSGAPTVPNPSNAVEFSFYP